MKFGNDLVINDFSKSVHKYRCKGGAHYGGILLIVHGTKPIFKFELEFNGSNLYMKFGRYWVVNVKVSTKGDRQAENKSSANTCWWVPKYIMNHET